jgi:hypothetical protein
MRRHMPNFDFNKVPNTGSFEPLPDGEYPMTVVDVKVTNTQFAGDERWGLTLEVSEGEHKGRRVWDSVTWTLDDPTSKAMQRLKLVMKAFGIDISEDREYQTNELFGQQVMVTIEGTTTSDNGKVFNKVKFNGYAPF